MKEFLEPRLEVMMFDIEDVVTTSAIGDSDNDIVTPDKEI